MLYKKKNKHVMQYTNLLMPPILNTDYILLP